MEQHEVLQLATVALVDSARISHCSHNTSQKAVVTENRVAYCWCKIVTLSMLWLVILEGS